MAEKQTGSVKWFDESYGFDFIAPNDCSEDRSIRAPVIDQFGWIQESGRGRDSLGLKLGGLEGQRLSAFGTDDQTKICLEVRDNMELQVAGKER
ncbi:unnamed protein product [Rhodiola kirilowii]